MPRKPSGAEKIGTIKEKQKNGDIYIYERKTKYDPIKRYNITVSKTLVGKILSGTSEVINTRPKRKSIDAEPHHPPDVFSALKQHIGMLDLVNHVSCKSCVTAEVEKATSGDRGLAQKILTLAWYAFASDGETWPGITSWSTKYAGLLPYRDTPISQDMYHKLFTYLGNNEMIKQSIFKHRVSMMGNGELLALDSTTVETESKNLSVGRKGIHKDKLVKNIYKVVEIYSVTSRQPVAYARIPGNIADGSTVENALKQLEALNIPKVEIVADSGHAAEANMIHMIRSGFPFIMHVPSDTKWIQPLIEEYREELMYSGEVIHCDPKFSGVTTMQMHDFSYERQRASKKSGLSKGDEEILPRRMYVHIYFSSCKKRRKTSSFGSSLTLSGQICCPVHILSRKNKKLRTNTWWSTAGAARSKM